MPRRRKRAAFCAGVVLTGTVCMGGTPPAWAGDARINLEAKAYDRVVEQRGPSKLIEDRRAVARAMADKGDLLLDNGRIREARAAYATLGKRFKRERDADIRSSVVRGAFGTAKSYEADGNWGKALKAYLKVARRYRGEPSAEVQLAVARSMFSAGSIQVNRKRYEKGIGTLDAVLDRYASLITAPPTVIRLDENGILKVDVPEVTAGGIRFRLTSGTEGFHTILAASLIKKAYAWHELGRPEAQAGTYRVLIDRFGASQVPLVRRFVAQGMWTLGGLYGEMGREEEAWRIYGQLVGSFADSDDPEVAKLVARVRATRRETLPGWIGYTR